jgi:hypothetical protein
LVTISGQIISENTIELRSTIHYLRRLNLFDEIVCIADTDKDSDIDEAAKLADKYLLRNFYTPEQVIDELNGLASCDWNFRLDDDEKLGETFVKELKLRLETAEDDAYWMPRMWLWPTYGTFLNCYHWYADAQVRLWKKGHLKAEMGVHMHPRVVGTSNSWGAHLFHLVLMNKTYEERVARCKNHAKLMGIPYDAFIKGIGLFYLPEHIESKLIIQDCIERMIP